jgi:hypothetical protein
MGALPPPDWTPPQSPVGYDRYGPDADPTLRLVGAITDVLRQHGPMTAEEMGMALVIYGYGPLLEQLDAPSPKRRRLRRKRSGPRWRQARLPGIK